MAMTQHKDHRDYITDKQELTKTSRLNGETTKSSSSSREANWGFGVVKWIPFKKCVICLTRVLLKLCFKTSWNNRKYSKDNQIIPNKTKYA